MPIQCTDILDITMFTCGQLHRLHLRWIMTTVQMAAPIAAEALDTPEAQEARWIAWKSKGAAADRIIQRRMRIMFTALLIATACVTVAVML